MSAGLTIAAVLAALGLVFVVGVWIQNRILDGPGRPIVVVDRRTLRLAGRRVAAAEDRGDLIRAHAGATAARLWLRQEVRTGPKRHRVRYARTLEWWELRATQLRDNMAGVGSAGTA